MRRESPLSRICARASVISTPLSLGFVAQIARAIKKDMTIEELERYYSEHNMRRILY